MPVMKKEIELNSGKKIWVRQANGMDKLKIERIQSQTFRKFRHFGIDPTQWTDDQHQEFADAIDEAGGGVDAQVESWLPKCVISEDVDIHTLTSDEIRKILSFVRGDDAEGALPLDS